MFYQARRFERLYDPLFAILGIVLLEVLVYLVFTLPERLSLAALGGLVMGFFFLLCLVRLEWGLIALIFLGISSARVPLYTQEFAGLYLSEVLVPLLLAAYVVRVLVRCQGPPTHRSTLLPLVLLVVVSAVSMVHGNLFWDPSVPTNHRYLIVQATGVALLVLLVGTFVLFANSFDIRKNLRWLLPALIALPTLGNVVGFLAVLALPREYIFLYFQAGFRDLTWLAPLWLSPLASWSGLTTLAAPLTFAAALYASRPRTRLFLWGCLLIQLAASIASLTLGTWMTIIAGLLTIAWLHSRRLFVGMLALLALLIVAEGVFIEGSTVSAIYKNAEQKQSFDRFSIWRDGLAIWSASPILGVGQGNYYSYSYRYGSFREKIIGLSGVSGSEQNPWGNAHNGYLQILGELGVMGLGLFLWFVVAALRRATRAVSGARTAMEKAFTTGAMGAFIGTLVQMFTMHGFYHSVTNGGYNTFPSGMYIWAIVAALVGVSRAAAGKTPSKWPPRVGELPGTKSPAWRTRI